MGTTEWGSGVSVHELTGSPLIQRARDLALAAHAGQVDKAGVDYATHPQRVAARVSQDAYTVAAAWLHDVVEDSPTTTGDLRAAGIPDAVVDAVDRLTRRDNETADRYYQRIREHPIALAVKLADIADNSDPDRLAGLPDVTRARLTRKYQDAHAALTGRAGEHHDGDGR